MNIFTWIWDKIKSIFLSFINEAFDAVSKKFIVEMKDLAVKVVTELKNTDLTSAEKREIAFNKIKEAALAKGLSFSSSIIYTLIEIAYQKVQKGA